MAISKDRVHQIKLLQENLQTIRKLIGWTIDDLGEKIGVSKQTISNLENANTKMSLTQYIAIRAVLDYEVQEHPENDVLPKAIHLLLDEENNLSQEAASGGADKSMVSKLFTGMIGPVAVGAGIGLFTPLGIVGGIASTGWLKSMLDNGKDT